MLGFLSCNNVFAEGRCAGHNLSGLQMKEDDLEGRSMGMENLATRSSLMCI